MKKLLGLVLMLGLTACAGSGGGGGGGGGLPTGGVIPPGDYRACYLTQGGGYADTLISFSASTFNILTVYYSNPGCTGSNLGSETSSGNFSLGGANADQIDYSYTSPSNSTIYDIYKVTGNTLNVGDRTQAATNGSDPSKRPTAYSSTIVFTKQ